MPPPHLSGPPTPTQPARQAILCLQTPVPTPASWPLRTWTRSRRTTVRFPGLPEQITATSMPLRQRECTLPRPCRPAPGNRGVQRPALPLKAGGKNPALPLPASWGCGHLRVLGLSRLPPPCCLCPHKTFSPGSVCGLFCLLQRHSPPRCPPSPHVDSTRPLRGLRPFE